MEESKAKNGLTMVGRASGSRENIVFPLRIGQKIKHSRIVLYKKENQKRIIVEEGTVIGLYPYIFRVKWDNHNWTECFPKWMLESTKEERIQAL